MNEHKVALVLQKQYHVQCEESSTISTKIMSCGKDNGRCQKHNKHDQSGLAEKDDIQHHQYFSFKIKMYFLGGLFIAPHAMLSINIMEYAIAQLKSLSCILTPFSLIDPQDLRWSLVQCLLFYYAYKSPGEYFNMQILIQQI